jgi:hypothetical protein
MDVDIWAKRPRPAAGPDVVVLGTRKPDTAGDVTWTRRHPSAAPRDGGRPPARVRVISDGRRWPIDASDAAPETPPGPPTDRDPAYGGLRLHKVARICATNGRWLTGGRKHVRPQIDCMRTDGPADRETGAR